MDLARFMTDNLQSLVATAVRGVRSNPREMRFALGYLGSLKKAERRRKRLKEKENLDVPPFLICSIATVCNLQCKGCYARNNGIATDVERKDMLSAEEWRRLFDQAVEMGFCVSLLAGGEPLTRCDVLEAAAGVKNMLFPVFTNGTMIGAQYVPFFRQHPNMLPVISLEGDASATDARRGAGVYKRVRMSMDMLHEAKVFYGVSITVTTENMERVTDPGYVAQLREAGVGIVFYVEYVPTDESTAHLALDEDGVQAMERRLEQLRQRCGDVVFVSFPGDEKLLGGCMAAGRGFFHVGPDGAAEPCPFAPQSDTNASRDGLRAALRSPFFGKLRDASALSWEHTGGCTLYEHRDEVDAMLKQ